MRIRWMKMMPVVTEAEAKAAREGRRPSSGGRVVVVADDAARAKLLAMIRGDRQGRGRKRTGE